MDDQFWEIMLIAQCRGFAPRSVFFDGWYANLEDLKLVRDQGWRWLTRLKANRKVNPEGRGVLPLSDDEIIATGPATRLIGYNPVRVAKPVAPDGGNNYRATSDQGMSKNNHKHMAEWSSAIENHHRDPKQSCGVEKSQACSARAQRNHIGMTLRAFLRLDHHFFTTGVSCHEAKRRVGREAIHRKSALSPPTDHCVTPVEARAKGLGNNNLTNFDRRSP